MAEPQRGGSLLSAGQSLFRALPALTPTFLVVALLACVLVPLPTALVDLLLSLSLAGAVLLLVASLGVRRTSEFLSFPTLLLLVTLYRLALNVSTTRLILSQADAGRVVDAFASVVVRNDLIVGGVMFGIITIIQYLVIARGAERVAEVAARFALDGLPGHQAAIEADLRAGLVSGREAARRREALVSKSSFYGAMDGAIRFVKGDAIAGLAITAVNLLGGLAIGVGRLDMSVGESLSVYGRLTIGDGLLAQIPALLVSLAAGVLVSRIDRGERSEWGRWLDPAMLVVPATMLLLLAVVPGMPVLAFVATAVGLLTAALWLAAQVMQRTRGRSPVEDARLHVVVPTLLEGQLAARERALAGVRERCSDALGLDVPEIDVVVDATQPSGTMDVRLGERVLARVPGAPTDTDAVFLLAVFRALMANAASLVDLPQIDRAIEQVRASYPGVVAKALDGIDTSDLLSVVRAFLRERIPQPPLQAILAAIAESRRLREPSERAQLPELMRTHLAGHWVHGVVDGVTRTGDARWVRLDPDLEEELLDRTLATSVGPALSLSGSDRATWRARNLAAGGDDTDAPRVLVTTPRARRPAAALFDESYPFVPVLSTAELERAGLPHPDYSWVG